MRLEAATAVSARSRAPADATRLRELKQADLRVRRHEQAHRIAGGAYTGPASYTYQAGPDGRNYAVAGEVRIDAAPVPGDVEATVAKMRIVIAAALAPVDPSTQDRAIAGRAARELQQAILAQSRDADAARGTEFDATA